MSLAPCLSAWQEVSWGGGRGGSLLQLGWVGQSRFLWTQQWLAVTPQPYQGCLLERGQDPTSLGIDQDPQEGTDGRLDIVEEKLVSLERQ